MIIENHFKNVIASSEKVMHLASAEIAESKRTNNPIEDREFLAASTREFIERSKIAIRFIRSLSAQTLEKKEIKKLIRKIETLLSTHESNMSELSDDFQTSAKTTILKNTHDFTTSDYNSILKKNTPLLLSYEPTSSTMESRKVSCSKMLESEKEVLLSYLRLNLRMKNEGYRFDVIEHMTTVENLSPLDAGFVNGKLYRERELGLSIESVLVKSIDLNNDLYPLDIINANRSKLSKPLFLDEACGIVRDAFSELCPEFCDYVMEMLVSGKIMEANANVREIKTARHETDSLILVPLIDDVIWLATLASCLLNNFVLTRVGKPTFSSWKSFDRNVVSSVASSVMYQHLKQSSCVELQRFAATQQLVDTYTCLILYPLTSELEIGLSRIYNSGGKQQFNLESVSECTMRSEQKWLGHPTNEPLSWGLYHHLFKKAPLVPLSRTMAFIASHSLRTQINDNDFITMLLAEKRVNYATIDGESKWENAKTLLETETQESLSILENAKNFQKEHI